MATVERRRGFHHVELWVADVAAVEARWAWLLSEVGFELAHVWPQGRSWSADGAYLTVTEAPRIAGGVHDRRSPGMNHLAFRGGSRSEVDAVMAAAAEHGWMPLYHDRYPHAGGPDHYAGWLADADGFKVEVVADPS